MLRQTVADFRLHVVGDGCDERTEAVVRAIGDSRVLFNRFPKATGYGYVHRNVVLRSTSAPFVAYITDDDLWFPDHLERGLRELEAASLSLVAFRSCHVQFPDVLDPHFFAFDWRAAAFSRFLRNWFMASVSCVHRRSVFDSVGYWDDRLFRFGDREFYNRVRVSAESSRYVDTTTVLRFYAQHWDHRYEESCEPPQPRYLALLADEEWRAALRAATVPGPRPFAVRRRQWSDFMTFGIRSGPKFARFLFQKLQSRDRPSRGVLHASRS